MKHWPPVRSSPTCAAAVVLGAALWCCALAGCGRKSAELSTTYGGRRGDAASSVNGLSVLAGMFEAAGHSVTSRSSAASGIDDVQVIVWAPDNFEPPTDQQRALIEKWLSEASDRTFVYIGRDYDAATAYWRRVADQAPAADFAAADRAAALAESAHDTARTSMPIDENVRWFVARRDRPRSRAKSLTGEWSENLDAAKAEIVLQGHFDVPAVDATDAAVETSDDEVDADESDLDEYEEDYDYEDYDYEDDTEEFELLHEVLLAAGGGGATANNDPFDEEGGFQSADGAPLVTRVSSTLWGSSQLLVVTNGSFLLNLPLVNHEHRKLAGRLIEASGEPGKVVFWESSAFRATTNSGDDEWSVLTTWPLNFILLHLAVLGMLYILWRFPIFGLAHKLRPPATSDFAKHIDALGKLTASTNDAAYAQRKLMEYRERVRKESLDTA